MNVYVVHWSDNQDDLHWWILWVFNDMNDAQSCYDNAIIDDVLNLDLVDWEENRNVINDMIKNIEIEWVSYWDNYTELNDHWWFWREIRYYIETKLLQ